MKEIPEPQKRLTLAQLRERTAKAIETATTFEKTPTVVLPVGGELLFRVKRVIEGKYDAPIVLASEMRLMDPKTGKFVKGATLDAYTQDGKDAPMVPTTVAPGEDIRIPSFLAKRATERDIEFHEKLVYWGKYIEAKEVPNGTYKVGAIMLVGAEFPDDDDVPAVDEL